jgi:Ulp1 family protease
MEESKARNNHLIDLSDWEDFTPQNIPHQDNDYDCGVFTCLFADYISRDEPFDFKNHHMTYFRERIAYEIITKSLIRL